MAALDFNPIFSAIPLLIFHFVAVRIEEPGLERRFGSSYVAYKRTVGRRFPRLKTAKFEGTCRPRVINFRLAILGHAIQNRRRLLRSRRRFRGDELAQVGFQFRAILCSVRFVILRDPLVGPIEQDIRLNHLLMVEPQQ